MQKQALPFRIHFGLSPVDKMPVSCLNPHSTLICHCPRAELVGRAKSSDACASAPWAPWHSRRRAANVRLVGIFGVLELFYMLVAELVQHFWCSTEFQNRLWGAWRISAICPYSADALWQRLEHVYCHQLHSGVIGLVQTSAAVGHQPFSRLQASGWRDTSSAECLYMSFVCNPSRICSNASHNAFYQGVSYGTHCSQPSLPTAD